MAVLNQAPDSQFAFVVVAGKRARQLMSGAAPLLATPTYLLHRDIVPTAPANSNIAPLIWMARKRMASGGKNNAAQGCVSRSVLPEE